MRAASLLIFIAVGFLAAPAQAHKVNLFAFVEGDQVAIEGYFNDGKRAQNSRVQVFGPEDELLVEGTTDDEGMFRFGIPQISDLKISLYAGMGHRAEYTLPASELGGSTINPTSETTGGMNKPAKAASASEGTSSPASSGGSAAGTGEMRNAAVESAHVEPVVRKAVGDALLPVMRSLSELKEQRTFSDIVGGIGFIVGILGVFFYLKARRMTGKPSSSGV